MTSRDSSLALTVYALRRRGLVFTVPADGIWTAEATDAGRYYVAHGEYPESLQHTGRGSPKAAPARRSAGKRELATPDEVVARIEAAGGTLTIPDPDPVTRAWWRNSVQAAIRDGRQVHYTGRMQGDLIVVMGAADRDDAQRLIAAGRPAPVEPVRPARRHLLVTELRDRLAEEKAQSDHVVKRVPCLPRVSARSMSQALRTLNALFIQAEARGHMVRPVDRPKPRKLARYRIVVQGSAFPVAVIEHGGVLVLRLEDVYSGRRLWHDGRRTRLECKVDDLLDCLEARVLEVEQRRRARQQADEELLNLHALEVAERRAAYERAWVSEFLRRCVADWHLADEIRSMCTRLEIQIGQGSIPADSSGWVAWAQEHAELMDPTARVLTIPQIPEPDPAELVKIAGAAPQFSMEV